MDDMIPPPCRESIATRVAEPGEKARKTNSALLQVNSRTAARMWVCQRPGRTDIRVRHAGPEGRQIHLTDLKTSLWCNAEVILENHFFLSARRMF